MTEDILSDITSRLDHTIKETELLYELCNYNVGCKKVHVPFLKDKSEVLNSANNWILPYTVPAEANKLCKDQRVKSNKPTTSKDHKFQRECVLRHKSSNDDQFRKFVEEAKHKMRLESERLQDEYNKQFATKLAEARKELYEANRASLMELQDLRLEKERWSCDEVETKKSLSMVSDNLESLKKSYDNLSKEIESKTDEIMRLNGELGNSNHMVSTLRQKHGFLEKDLFDKAKHIERLQDNITELYSKLEFESNKLLVSERNAAQMGVKCKELQEELTKLKVDHETLILKHQFTISERDSLTLRNSKLESDLSEMTNQTLELQSRISDAQVTESSTIVALRDKIQKLEDELREARLELIRVNKSQELAHMNKHVEDLQSQIKILTGENDALVKENFQLQTKLEDEKKSAKEAFNDLFAAKCHLKKLMNSKRRGGDGNKSGDCGCTDECEDLECNCLDKVNVQYVNRRNLFEPTMFDGPDEATQMEIDKLEKELTELHLEKDRLESEIIRCNIGPGSPAMERRRHQLLEEEITNVRKRIHMICEDIKKLYN